MKRLFTSIFALSVMILIAAAGEPKVKNIDYGDGSAKPGENVEMSVTFSGKAKSIASVEMVVREFPYDAPPIIFKAEDAKKKVWKTTLPVPYEAPPGKYHLELKVVLNSGDQLVVEETKDQAYGKAGVAIVEVK